MSSRWSLVFVMLAVAAVLAASPAVVADDPPAKNAEKKPVGDKKDAAAPVYTNEDLERMFGPRPAAGWSSIQNVRTNGLILGSGRP